MLSLVIATDDYAMPCIAKCDRENAGGFAGFDWRVEDFPMAATITRVQHARACRRAQANPRVVFSVNGDVSTTGGEGAFILQSRRRYVRHHTRPGLPAICSQQNV